MADRNKFEEMLEKLVNEDKAGAEELFHEIVVEKSRDIYEGLLEADLEVDEADDEETKESSNDEEVDEASKDEEVDESDEEEVDEASKDDDEDVKEDFDLDEFEVEGDPADDMMDKMGMDDDGEGDMDMDMDMDGDSDDEDLEDRVDDLETALDDLKAEFDKMMGDEEGGDEEGDMDMDMDMDMGDEGEAEDESVALESKDDEEVDEASDEEVDESDDEETDESTKSEAEQMREYVEKVAGGGLDAQKIGGDNGANTKSPVASKNDMGGDASNLVAGGEADTGGTSGGLAGNTPKVDDHKNVNKPGGKAGKSMSNMPKGHGAEKKGAGDTAANKKPVMGG